MTAVHDVAARVALRELADEAGIVPGYHDQTGREWREPTDETRQLLLGAMGFAASSEAEAARTLERLRAERIAHPLDPVRVARQSDDAHRVVAVRLPRPQARALRWELSVVTEDGERHDLAGEAAHGAGHSLAIRLPIVLPLGYHTVRVALQTDAGPVAAEQLLIVVPDSCLRADQLLQGRRAWGLVVNLYTLRSARNWGIGDLTDLGTLVEWAAGVGAQFVGLNPLHAIRNRGRDVSPYAPITRLFRNPAYIDVDAVPELALAPGARLLVDSAEFQRGLEVLRASADVDYERVMAVKWPVLRACYDAARVRDVEDRWPSFRDWAARHDPELTAFARYMARDVGGFRGESTPEFDDGEASDVDFHRWVQWELERQLGDVCRRAAKAGMRIGLYQDLAIGSSADGSDAEAEPTLFARGVSVGAPPDPYSAHGQNWGFPPVNPHRLRDARYRYFIELVKAGFRNAGALRIDHVMGLFRLFWIPEGHSGKEGAYVRFPAEDLLGILALESVRNQALVVGEDLGTVPPDVPPALERWGILSSKVLYFERGEGGTFRRTADYPPHSLATANTHDMATLLGFMRGRDVELRIAHGLVPEGAADEARAERERDKRHLIDRLVEDGVLDRESAGDATRFRAAIHDLLAASPAVLVGVALDDVAGEVEAVNLPGVSPDRHPSWTRRMTKSLEQIVADPSVLEALGSRLRQGRA